MLIFLMVVFLLLSSDLLPKSEDDLFVNAGSGFQSGTSILWDPCWIQSDSIAQKPHARQVGMGSSGIFVPKFHWVSD